MNRRRVISPHRASFRQANQQQLLRRIPEHRRAFLVLAGCTLGALLVTTAALTIRALAADRSARLTTDRSLEHLATVAAWEMSRHLSADLDAAGRISTVPAARLNGRLVGDPPTAEQLFNSPSLNCNCPRLVALGYLESKIRAPSRLVRLTGNGWAAGDTALLDSLMDAVVARRLGTTGSTVANEHHEGLEVHMLAGHAEQSRLLFTQPVHSQDGRLAAVYGVLISPASADSFFAASITRASLLPESITERIPPDSLLQISILTRDSTTVFRTRTAAALTDHAGRNVVGPVAPGIAVEARMLSPATVIMAGLLPDRATAPILLFLVTGILIIAIGWVFMRRVQLDAMRAEFLAGVAHEFHTPLALISAYAETPAQDERERSRFMALIVRESQRLSHLVDNVQRVVSSARRPTTVLQTVSLTSTVADALAAFETLATAHGNTIVSEVQPNVDVRGDVAGIRNALFNVLDNAVRYGGAGQPIHVSLVRAGVEAEVIVDDEGPGIPKKDRERVFERYVRLTSAFGPEAAAGSGIGLSIVHEIMTFHGGRVGIESAPGGGARVRLTWPIAS